MFGKVLKYLKKLGFFLSLKLFYLKIIGKILSRKSKIKTLKFKGKDIYFRTNTSDISVFAQVFVYEEYKSIKKLITNYNEVKIIVDCGANIGMTSLYFKKNFPKAKIFSIEADYNNFEILKLNIKKFENIIIPIYGAVWYKNGYVKIANPDAAEWSFFVTDSDCQNNTIPSFTIDTFMKNNQIDFIDILKIDIEGGEFSIFSYDDCQFLEITKVIAIELHDRKITGCRESVIKKLKNYNFLIEEIGQTVFGVKK